MWLRGMALLVAMRSCMKGPDMATRRLTGEVGAARGPDSIVIRLARCAQAPLAAVTQQAPTKHP